MLVNLGLKDKEGETLISLKNRQSSGIEEAALFFKEVVITPVF
jgi:hypothetical protein